MNLETEVSISQGSFALQEFQDRLQKIRGKDKVYKNNFLYQQNTIPSSYTFNDVLMVPQYSEV